MREQIASAFNKDSRWNRIFKTELITEDLPKFVETEEERKLIKEFERFTTYLNEYHNNRKNIYSVKEKSTAIAYRIVNENLPRFIDNGKVMEKLFEIPELQDNFRQLQADLDSELCGKDIKVLFDLSHFNDFLSQEGIELYNTIIGGKAEEGKTIKIKGINEYINQYNQQCEGKLPKLKMLLKQILSDRNVISWLPKQFEDDNELLKSLEQCYQEITNRVLICKGERDLSHLLASIKEPNTNLYQIFLTNDKHLNEISAKVFGSWDVIQTAILSTTIERKPRERENKYEERKKKYWESHAYFSIGFINECLLRSGVTVTGSLVEYFVKIGKDRDTGKNLIDEVKESYGKVKNLLSTPYSAEKRLIDDEDNVLNIKKLLDSLKALQYFIKPLAGSDDESQKDERFYGEFEAMWQTLHCVTFLYDKARNYLTCKPYSAKKIKLNFENPTLLNGWDSDKEKDYSCFMLRKEKDYFLGIFENKNKRNIDFNNKSPQNNEGYYEKMRYKKVAKPEQDIFNLMVIDGKTQKKNGRKEKEGENIGKNIRLEELKNKYLPDNINRIRKSGSYLRSNASFKKQDLIDFIDYYKERVIEYNKELLFNFKASSEYNTFDDFTNHVKQQGYSLTFSCISEKYINSLVDEGEVYLFKIRNKDLSGNSKGTPNLHTIYWKMLLINRI